MSKKGVLIVISGFSGAGKGTLMKKLVADYDNYALSISMTTRDPREGEQHGREYFFVTKEEFEDRIANNGMIEYATYCGNFYGTPKAYVEEQLENGKDVILEIEIQGALKIKEKYPDAVLIFITTKDAKTLKERLTGRGTEAPEVIAQRLNQAKTEMIFAPEFDYQVINDDVDRTKNEILDIIANIKKDRN